MPLLTLAMSLVVHTLGAQAPPARSNADDAHARTVAVPIGDGQSVVIDGTFSKGEWDDAICNPIAPDRTLCLKADSKSLYVGVRAPEPVVIGVCEIRHTENGKDFHLMHVSARLGIGVSPDPGSGKFDMGDVGPWDANLSVENESKVDAWIAAGRPFDMYAEEVGEKVEGKEFRIDRAMIAGERTRFTIGWIEIATDGKKSYNYPEDVSYENADNWVELILPKAD